MTANSHSPHKSSKSIDARLALNALLMAADSLCSQGRFSEAELRLVEALALAQSKFGEHSDQLVLVLTVMAAFYRRTGKHDEAFAMEQRISGWVPVREAQSDAPPSAISGPLGRQFASTTQGRKPAQRPAPWLRLPENVRKACQMLGISTDAPFTADEIQRAWKKELLERAAHPDLGGNTDEAVLLNRAKTELLNYLDCIVPRSRTDWKTAR